jgi:hypothetical protein
MTIALGILSSSGAQILAADTQMSTDGEEKFAGGKISFQAVTPAAENDYGCIAITGAGDEFLFRALQEDITSLFTSTVQRHWTILRPPND